jgi:hypothetical protein
MLNVDVACMSCIISSGWRERDAFVAAFGFEHDFRCQPAHRQIL